MDTTKTFLMKLFKHQNKKKKQKKNSSETRIEHFRHWLIYWQYLIGISRVLRVWKSATRRPAVAVLRRRLWSVCRMLTTLRGCVTRCRRCRLFYPVRRGCRRWADRHDIRTARASYERISHRRRWALPPLPLPPPPPPPLPPPLLHTANFHSLQVSRHHRSNLNFITLKDENKTKTKRGRFRIETIERKKMIKR